MGASSSGNKSKPIKDGVTLGESMQHQADQEIADSLNSNPKGLSGPVWMERIRVMKWLANKREEEYRLYGLTPDYASWTEVFDGFREWMEKAKPEKAESVGDIIARMLKES